MSAPDPHAHPVDVHVGMKVRTRRRELGLSQERLAQGVGVTFQQIQKYERGANRISCSALVKIAATLRTPPSYFVDDGPGADASPPQTDAFAEAHWIMSDAPGALEALRCYGAMSPARRSAALGVLRGLAERDAPPLKAVG